MKNSTKKIMSFSVLILLTLSFLVVLPFNVNAADDCEGFNTCPPDSNTPPIDDDCGEVNACPPDSNTPPPDAPPSNPNPPVLNSCPLPDALEDTTVETVNPAPEGEQDLWEILANDTAYTLDVQTDQKQYQVWNVSPNSTITIDAKFVNKFAGHNSVFGYYISNATFVPIFKTANITGYESTPLYTENGGMFTVETGEASTLIFAIKTFNGATDAGTFATLNSMNDGNDQVVVYNPDENKYVLGFEDIAGGDNDYNDLVVEITLSCENIEIPPEETTATIIATKIVCPTENLLPNWGDNGPNITSTTASSFLAEHPTCHLEPWPFEWALNGTPNPGDNTGSFGSPWTSFNETATIPSGNLIWVREVWNDDYIPFTGVNTTQNVSAEFYCHTDVLNYDNYDWINPVEAKQTYYCVGFNVLKEIVNPPVNNAPIANAGADQTITLPTNSVTLDGSGSSDSDGTIVSYNWTFVSGPSTIDPNDTVSSNATGLVAGTYVFKLTVTDNDGASAEDTVSIVVNSASNTPPQCSDGVDNDGDGKTDFTGGDPGCDNSTDDNETNSDGNSGGSSGSHKKNTTGQVLGAETSCGIYVEKFLRVGYNNNVEAVKKVQTFLNNYMTAGLKVDGIYGTKTEAAMKTFQLAYKEKILNPWGITAPTGIFYLTTQTEVNNIMCPTLNLPIPANLTNFTPRAIN